MQFYVAVIDLPHIRCGNVPSCMDYAVEYGGCRHLKVVGTKRIYKFRDKLRQAKADLTRAANEATKTSQKLSSEVFSRADGYVDPSVGFILVGDTDDMARLDMTKQEQFEHFESRMLIRTQAAQANASKPIETKPKRSRKAKP